MNALIGFIILLTALSWICPSLSRAQNAATPPPEKVIIDEKGTVAAAATGNVEQLRRLIRETGPDVRDSQGRTPLMAAAINRQLQAVRFLVRHGADINAVDLDGYSVLALVSVLGGTTGAMESYLESRGAVLCVPWNIVDCPSKSMRDLEDFKTALALSALPE